MCVWSVCFRAYFNKLSNILPGEFHKRRNIYKSVCVYRSVCECCHCACVFVCVCGWLLLKNVISPCRSRRTYVAGFLLYCHWRRCPCCCPCCYCCCCPCCYSCCCSVSVSFYACMLPLRVCVTTIRKEQQQQQEQQQQPRKPQQEQQDCCWHSSFG